MNLLTTLPPRMALVHQGVLGTTVLVQLPTLTFREPPTEELIVAEMRPILERVIPWPREQCRPDAHVPKAQPVPTERPKDEAVASATPAREQINGTLPLEVLKYLERCNDDPLWPVTLFDKRGGVSLAGGNRIRGQLVEAGLIDVEAIRTGKRGASVRCVRLTEKGFEILKAMGVAPKRLNGKGSVASQFWQLQICRHVLRLHSQAEPVIEDNRWGKAVDVGVEVDGVRRAYEVCLSSTWISQNVIKDLLAGYDEVVLCGVTDKDVRAVQAKLQDELGESAEWSVLRPRVKHELLWSFLPSEMSGDDGDGVLPFEKGTSGS
jgi:hypothetical protein